MSYLCFWSGSMCNSSVFFPWSKCSLTPSLSYLVEFSILFWVAYYDSLVCLVLFCGWNMGLTSKTSQMSLECVQALGIVLHWFSFVLCLASCKEVSFKSSEYRLCRLKNCVVQTHGLILHFNFYCKNVLFKLVPSPPPIWSRTAIISRSYWLLSSRAQIPRFR